jgi:hypothetical protein
MIMRHRGQPAAWAVVMSWRTTPSRSMVTAGWHTVRLAGSRYIITVRRVWSVWFITIYYAIEFLNAASTHQNR